MFGLGFEYILPFIVLLIFCLGQGLVNTKNNNYVYWSIVVYIILMVGLRYQVGPDWPGYYGTYETILAFDSLDFARMEIATGMEKGYLFFNVIFATLDLPMWALQIFLASLSIGLKSYTIFNYSKMYYVGLILYVMPLMYFEDIIQIRQGLAIGIALFSIKFIIERKLWWFLGILFLGSFIHGSIISFIPAFWIARAKLNSTYMLILLVFSVLSSSIGLIEYIKPVLELLPVGSVQRGLQYIKEGTADAYAFSFADVGKIIFALIVIQYHSFVISKDPKMFYILNIFFYSIVLYFILRADPIFSTRLTGYYSSSIVLALPAIFYYLQERRLDFRIIYFIFLLYIVLLTWRFIQINGQWFTEYYNFLYHKIDFELR